MRNFELNDEQAKMVFQQVSSHCQSIKNWMASAVEDGKFEYAQELVKQLRAYQVLYAKFNIEAHDLIANAKGAKS